MRFKRPCKKCEKMFRPTGRDTKLCDKCRIEAKRGWRKKQNIYK